MEQILKKYPVPATGLILGLAAAGNLVQSYGEVYRSIFGILSAALFILMTVKIVKYPKGLAEALDNPLVAGVFPTFSMSIMLLSTYLKQYAQTTSLALWIIGFIFHITLIIWFTKKYVLNLKIKQVFPSWFIVYVGIVVASVTGPGFKMNAIGQSAFWFGFVTYPVLLAIVLYRVIRIKEIAEAALPSIAIFAAPASLLLAGYMNSFETKNIAIVWILVSLSFIMYTAVVIAMFKLLRLKFYPSYSSFTFPFVISGIAMKLTNGFLINSGQGISVLKYLVKFQEAAAVVLTLYVLLRYIKFVLSTDKAATTANVKAQ
ncbi:C4-dicarboxylate transporter/malic acid transport protein [Oxobacter pfennigii]|uniref:C4-dicarboxylate transporter/malic acid transport protein n=1 Tax=Oxobacter pfennigii TaxID=36849 RepID=A0A0P8WC94_9CLOT|nr:TDT family transporter [Oxobacter pfennigii]KPU45516.1 C4-dicarboxylate transporter/malic acid transport protein [Oxobacter pfennigii]